MSNYSLYVGVDISAKTATVSWGCNSEELSSPITIKQHRTGWQKLVDKLVSQVNKPEACLVVMEATGTYWMQMALYLYEAGLILSVINPIRSKYFARMMLQQTKTDEVDARLLARLGMMMELSNWTPPPTIYHDLQQRLAYRDDLVAMRLQERNRLHALSHQSTIIASVQQRLEAHIQIMTQQIKELDQEIKALLASDHEWAQSAIYLQSIPGIGANTTAWILTATLNFSACDSPEQAVSFAGLAPHARQSGTSLNSKQSIGHGGHERLRRALYLAALPAARFNSIIQPFYQGLVARGKPKKVALCAAARKLLHLAWAVVTKKQLFDPKYTQHPGIAYISA
ncbi:MAG: IS110 family transposase [Phototrophicaceae bacterium]